MKAILPELGFKIAIICIAIKMLQWKMVKDAQKNKNIDTIIEEGIKKDLKKEVPCF